MQIIGSISRGFRPDPLRLVVTALPTSAMPWARNLSSDDPLKNRIYDYYGMPGNGIFNPSLQNGPLIASGGWSAPANITYTPLGQSGSFSGPPITVNAGNITYTTSPAQPAPATASAIIQEIKRVKEQYRSDSLGWTR